jgi:hypothetical protein
MKFASLNKCFEQNFGTSYVTILVHSFSSHLDAEKTAFSCMFIYLIKFTEQHSNYQKMARGSKSSVLTQFKGALISNHEMPEQILQGPVF